MLQTDLQRALVRAAAHLLVAAERRPHPVATEMRSLAARLQCICTPASAGED